MKAFNIKIAYFLLLACCLEKTTAAALPEEDLPPETRPLIVELRDFCAMAEKKALGTDIDFGFPGNDWSGKYTQKDEGFNLEGAEIQFFTISYDRFADRTTITIVLEKRESDKSFEYADNGGGHRTTRATIKTTLPGFYLAQSLGMEIYTNEITGIDRKNINVMVKKGNSFTFGRLENGEKRSLSLRDIPNLIKANKTIKEIDNNKIKDKSLREIGIYLEIAK